MEPYVKEVQFFRQFNVAWIFCWEYQLHQYLPTPFPLSLVRLYKIKWWNDFKSKLCGEENVEHFFKTNSKKLTLHNLHHFEKTTKITPTTPTKKDSSSSSTKSKAKGLSQKEKDLLEYLKDDPEMRQIVLQKILDKTGDSDDDETVSLAASSSPPKPTNPCLQDSQDPMKCTQKDEKSFGSWQKAKSQIFDPARGNCPLAKVKSILFSQIFSFAGYDKTVGKSTTDK